MKTGSVTPIIVPRGGLKKLEKLIGVQPHYYQILDGTKFKGYIKDKKKEMGYLLAGPMYSICAMRKLTKSEIFYITVQDSHSNRTLVEITDMKSELAKHKISGLINRINYRA